MSAKLSVYKYFWVRKINLFHGHLYNSFKFNPLLKKKKSFIKIPPTTKKKKRGFIKVPLTTQKKKVSSISGLEKLICFMGIYITHSTHSVAASGYIFWGVNKKMHFVYKKRRSESCGLHDSFITKFFIVRTSKRIKDEKYYIYNIFTTLFQQILRYKLLLVPI